jgi:hypothetical protein
LPASHRPFSLFLVASSRASKCLALPSCASLHRCAMVLLSLSPRAKQAHSDIPARLSDHSVLLKKVTFPRPPQLPRLPALRDATRPSTHKAPHSPNMAQEPTWAKDEEWTPSHTTEWLEERLAAIKRGGKQIDVLEGFDLSDTDIDALRGNFVQFLINNGDHDKIANAGSHSHWLNLQKRKQAPAWLLETSCPRLRNEEVPADFRLMAAGVVYDKVLNQIRVNKRQSESRESASTTLTTSNTPTTRPSRSTASLNTGIRSNLGTENLHSSQAALNVSNATFVIHHGLTNNAIRSFPMISMLKPRHSDDL